MSDGAQPEFRIVVRRSSGPGPLAPFRLALAVGVAMLVAGRPLYESLVAGTANDAALLIAAQSGAFTWIVLLLVDRVLARRRPESPRKVA